MKLRVWVCSIIALVQECHIKTETNTKPQRAPHSLALPARASVRRTPVQVSNTKETFVFSLLLSFVPLCGLCGKGFEICHCQTSYPHQGGTDAGSGEK